MRLRTGLGALLAGLAVIALAPAGWAQGTNSSAQQIIQSLQPSAPMPSPAPAGSKTPATPVAAAPTVNLNVEFARDSAVLTPAAEQTLDALGQALTSQQLATYRFRIEGHTDTVGNPVSNRVLSQNRADAVARYLEHKFGISPGRLETVGMGEKGLLVPTPPNTPEPTNRRVQVINLGR